MTFATFQLEISASKASSSKNISAMSSTPDTSHPPIGPCGPVEQLPSGERSVHLPTKTLSSTLERGGNTGEEVEVVVMMVVVLRFMCTRRMDKKAAEATGTICAANNVTTEHEV